MKYNNPLLHYPHMNHLPKPKAPIRLCNSLTSIVFLLRAQQSILPYYIWNSSFYYLFFNFGVVAVPVLVAVVDQGSEKVNVFVQADWGVVTQFLLVVEGHFEEIVVLRIQDTAVPA